jgi:hypothetical protein
MTLDEQTTKIRRKSHWATYIEAISARDADTGRVKTQVAMYSHTVPALPPLINEKVAVPNIASQVDMITHVSPRMDMERKFRYIHQQSILMSTACLLPCDLDRE